MKKLVAYVPVLHEGYRLFFERTEGPKELFIFGPSITNEYRKLAKEIRQLDPELMRKAIEALGIFAHVHVLNMTSLEVLNKVGNDIILPDEEVSRELAQKYLRNATVTFDSIFLRWDKHNALAERPVLSDSQVTHEELHQKFLKEAETESLKSSDIWRHVGALIVQEGKVLLINHNTHLPSEHTPYVNGDPRNNFSKGEYIEFSSAIHAEAALIAEAARKGTSLEGLDMYVTVFPCPPCAKLIAQSGIKNLYCGGGYAVLDGEEILRAAGVTINFVG